MGPFLGPFKGGAPCHMWVLGWSWEGGPCGPWWVAGGRWKAGPLGPCQSAHRDRSQARPLDHSNLEPSRTMGRVFMRSVYPFEVELCTGFNEPR